MKFVPSSVRALVVIAMSGVLLAATSSPATAVADPPCHPEEAPCLPHEYYKVMETVTGTYSLLWSTYIGPAVAQINAAVADASCVPSQVTATDPNRGGPLCRTTGTAVATGRAAAANAVATVNATVASVLATGACVASQVSSPDPARGDQVCRAAGTAVQTGNQVKAAADGVAATAVSEANCAASQLTAPDPARGSAICRNVGQVSQDAHEAGVTPPGDYSGTCSAASTLADGYAGSLYVRLRIQRVDPERTWICYRISGATVDAGGRVEVRSAGASSGPPSIDDNAAACTTPVFSNTIGDPVNQTITLSTQAGTGAAWVCLRAGDFAKRVVVAVPGVSVPSIAVDRDAPAPPSPPASSPPSAYPSATCQGEAAHQRLLALSFAGDGNLWLSQARPDATTVDLCLREEGPVGAGGLLRVSATGSPGVSVTPGLSDDLSPCTVVVNNLDYPARVHVTRSPTGQLPASICVEAPGVAKRFYLDTTSGMLQLPSASWTPDPQGL